MLTYTPTKLLSIEAGPVIGVCLGSRLKGYEQEDKNESFHGVEFGANAGLRYKISKRLSLACRYYQGVENIAEIYFKNKPKDGIRS